MLFPLTSLLCVFVVVRLVVPLFVVDRVIGAVLVLARVPDLLVEFTCERLLESVTLLEVFVLAGLVLAVLRLADEVLL